MHTRILFLCVVFALVSGCGGPPPAPKLIAFSQANNAEAYRAAQNAVMQAELAKAPDVRLIIADAEQDNAQQIAQIGEFIRQKPAVLIVAPNERTAITDIMGQAMQAGIPVICLDRDIVQPNYTTYIRIDNRAIGRKAGQFIVNQLTAKYGTPRGNVVIIRGLLGVEGEINRDGGAREVMYDYPEIHIVADPVADWMDTKASDRMAEVLRTQPVIDVVYAHNDPMAIGAYRAAKAAHREHEMIFVGVDGLTGPEGGIKQVMDGVMAATWTYPLGVHEAAEIALKIIRDPTYAPPKQMLLESRMVTPANAGKLYRRGDDK